MKDFLNVFVRIMLCILYVCIGYGIWVIGYFDPVVNLALMGVLCYFAYATWSDAITRAATRLFHRLRAARKAHQARKIARAANRGSH